MSRTVSIDEMADAINEGLKEYATLASSQVKSAVRKSAKTVKDQISANAPSRTGAYKGSWVATKQSESSQSLQMVVHSKNRYQLAHLLEKGHAKRGGGRVAGYCTVKMFFPVYFNPSLVPSFTLIKAGTATAGSSLSISTT